MTHAALTDRLSEYLDDSLSRGERLDVERHLLDCADCRRTLDELRAVVAEARRLPDIAPASNLWPAVAGQIGTAWRPRRVSLPVPAAIAAGVLLALTSALSAWAILNRPAPVAADARIEQPTTVAVRASSMPTVPYGQAVDDLRTALASRRDRLNPRTVQVLERSLTTIDTAIADALAVLAEHPDDLALVSRVAEQRQLKVSLLRQVEKLTESGVERVQ